MSTVTPDAPEQLVPRAAERSWLRRFPNTYLRPAVVLTLILTILTGFIYPGIVTGIAQVIFPYQSHGSLIKNSSGQIIGSELIGQYWSSPQYFHGRPLGDPQSEWHAHTV